MNKQHVTRISLKLQPSCTVQSNNLDCIHHTESGTWMNVGPCSSRFAATTPKVLPIRELDMTLCVRPLAIYFKSFSSPHDTFQANDTTQQRIIPAMCSLSLPLASYVCTPLCLESRAPFISLEHSVPFAPSRMPHPVQNALCQEWKMLPNECQATYIIKPHACPHKNKTAHQPHWPVPPWIPWNGLSHILAPNNTNACTDSKCAYTRSVSTFFRAIYNAKTSRAYFKLTHQSRWKGLFHCGDNPNQHKPRRLTIASFSHRTTLEFQYVKDMSFISRQSQPLSRRVVLPVLLIAQLPFLHPWNIIVAFILQDPSWSVVIL